MPRLADHEERRREAVEALWRVIATLGIDKASVRHVAAETGWSRGIIDYYFDSMQELLVAGLRAACDADVQLEAGPSDDGAAALRGALLARMPLDEARRLRGKVWIAYLGRAMSDPEIAAVYAACQRDRGAMWMRVLADGVPDDEVDPRQMERSATLVMAFELAMNVNGQLNPDSVTQESVKQELDAFLDSLAAFATA